MPELPPPDTLLDKLSGYSSLGLRVKNALFTHKLVTAGDLCDFTEDDMVCTRNFGMSSLLQLLAFMRGNGLEFRPAGGASVYHAGTFLSDEAAHRKYQTEPRYHDLVDWMGGLVLSGAFTRGELVAAARLGARAYPRPQRKGG